MVWIHWNDFVICWKTYEKLGKKTEMQNHPVPALFVVCKETFNLEYVSKLIKVDHLFA